MLIRSQNEGAPGLAFETWDTATMAVPFVRRAPARVETDTRFRLPHSTGKERDAESGPNPSCCWCCCASVSKNFGRTPETPLCARSRTKRENASSELSPLKSSPTSMGFAGSSSAAPGGATCSLPTMFRPMTFRRAMELAPTTGPNSSCKTCRRYPSGRFIRRLGEVHRPTDRTQF